jgi:dynein heavy chain
MSPSGDSLRNNCRSFPGLVGNTTIDWVFPWPDPALQSVAKGYLMENKKIPDFLKESITEHVVHVHNSLTYYTQEYLTTLRRRNYITPKHYLDYLNTYINLLDEKDQAMTKQITRLTDGTQKISFASTQIGELRIDVEETKVKVVESAQVCEKFLKEIEECKIELI